MRAVAIIAVILMVALVTMNEAKPFGRRGHGHKKGHRDQDSERPECHSRCPRPTRRSRVCASDGLRNRTYPSACLVDKIACKKNINITIVAEGACPRPRSVNGFGMGGNKESESKEDSNSLESNEEEDTVTTTTSAPATSPSSEPSTSVDTMTSVSTSDTSAPSGPTVPPTPPTPQTPPALVTSSSGPATVDPTTAASSPAPGVTGPGTTCVTSCPVASSPVCGTDGATYGSACVLEAYACANKIDGLTVAYEGACVP
ncbi:extracellular protease inhibitor 10-like [Patiria miniata]|uniref:Kazal-like domain-containing protein n=1 Tax=Patiria miniata TaxID=46514 RepID=A0A914ASC0_PATMI|nr:extracellular protease inhibitor 10-like [Patiria miniata]